MRGTTLAAVAMAGLLALTACGTSSNSGGAPAASSAGAPAIKVGLAYDIGGRGDQSFNDSAARGLDNAKAESGVQVKELEASRGETDAQKEDRLRQLAEGGYNPVIAVGFAYAKAVGKVAKDNPESSSRSSTTSPRAPTTARTSRT